VIQATGRSYSSIAMCHNKVAFGTPEAKDWFLSKMLPQDASMDTDFALRTIFTDFYSHIANYRNKAGKVMAAKALTKADRRDECLKSRDSAHGALADKLRNLMGLSFLLCYPHTNFLLKLQRYSHHFMSIQVSMGYILESAQYPLCLFE
jgi:hypothetical protein